MDAYSVYGAQLGSRRFEGRLERAFAALALGRWESGVPETTEWSAMRLLAEDLARYDAGCWHGDLSRPSAVIGIRGDHPGGVKLTVHVMSARQVGLGTPGAVVVAVRWTGVVRAPRTAMVIHGYLSRLHELGFALWDGLLRQPVTPTGPDQWLLAGAAPADAEPTGVPAAASEQVPAVAVPTEAFDPMVQPLTVDDLPAELGWRQVEVMADACAVIARPSDETDPDNPRWEVVVSAHRGRRLTDGPLLAAPDYQGRLTPAPPVHGRPAYWLKVMSDRSANPHRTGTETVLRWADGPGYVQVSVYGPDTGGRELARRVADSVHCRAAQPVRLPFTLGPLPGGLIPQFVRVAHGAPDRAWQVELRCAHEPMWGRPSGPFRGLEIRCYPSTRLSSDREAPDRFVDGRPALFKQGHLLRDGRYESLTLFDVHGHHLRIQALGDRACTAIGPAGVLGLSRTLQLTPHDWTATPFT